jgi:hypothetical protein
MAMKKQLCTIRTDYLENWIGFYKAHRQEDIANALCKVARDVGAPIEFEEVERMRDIHKPYKKEDQNQLKLELHESV